MKITRRSFAGRARLAGLGAALILTACGGETPQSFIESGKSYVDKKDFKAAAIQFKSALQKDGGSAEARYLLGKALLDSGDPAGAEVELSKALDQNVDAKEVLPPLARALLLTGQARKLATLYGEMTFDDKAATADLKSSVATAWGSLGDKAKTEAAIAAALQADPEHGPARILQARIMAGQAQYEPALALVEKVLAHDKSLYEAWLLKGEIIDVAKKDTPGAEAAFRQALMAEKAYLPAHTAIISSRLRARDIPGARAQADQMRAVLPNHPLTVFIDAQIAFYDRDLKKSRELVQQLLRAAPNFGGALLLAGAIEGQSGSLVQAESYFAKALQNSPDSEMARRNLALTYVRLGQPAKALETLKPLLAIPSPSANTLALAGEAELRLGNAAAAEERYVQAARLAPTDHRLQTALALTQLSRGDAAAAFGQLEDLAAKSTDTYTDQAIVSARLKRREFDAALVAVDAMLKKEPKSAGVYELRGSVQTARRDFVGARADLEQALKLDPALFSAVANLAAIDLAEKKPDQARQRLEDAVKADPRNSYALMALADLKLRLGAPVDAVKPLLADAIKAAPSLAAPRLQLIELTLRKRQFEEALNLAREAAAAVPNDLGVLDAVGRAQMEAGDVQQAISTFRRMASLDEKSPVAYTRLADVFKASGQIKEAEAALRKALDIEPELASAQAALLNLMISTKRSQEALDYTLRVQKDRPGKPEGYMLEAAFHLRNKSPDAAIGAYRKGLGKSDSTQLARSLYLLLESTGRQAEADRFGVGWMDKHPNDNAIEFQLAVTNVRRKEYALAETRLQRVVKRQANNPLAQNNLGWVLATLGKPGAVEHAQRAVNLAPKNANMYDTLAMALAAEKKFEDAMATQKQAMDLAPQNQFLRLNLAKLALQAGDKALARKELEHLKSLGAAFDGQTEVARLLAGV